MAEFFAFLKTFLVCGTVLFVVMLVLLALPQSKLRCVGLEIAKWIMAGVLLVMVPLPCDLLPDIAPPFTYIDDVGYLVGAVAAARGALGERKKRRLYEEIELKELQAKAKE